MSDIVYSETAIYRGALRAEPLSIIIADDDESSRLILEKYLRHTPHDLRIVKDGEEALRAYDENPAHILILDWEMPAVNGLGVSRQIRDGFDGDLPVIIMLTSKNRNEDLELALANGVDDFITKPVKQEMLLHRITIASRTYADRLALKEVQNRYHILFLNCGDYILLFDRQDGRLLEVNVSALVALEYPQQALLGRPVDSLFEGPSVLAHAKSANSSGTLECQHISASGVRVPLEIRMSLVQRHGVPVIQAHCRDISERKRAERKLADFARQLELENKSLERQSQIDAMTGIANRRWLDSALDREVGRARRYLTEISVVMIDVDFFKYYNDSMGHQAGDECLIEVAKALKSVLYRGTDVVARYGGEEFCIVLPDTAKEGALAVAERARLAVENMARPHPKSQVAPCVTISLGVASAKGSPQCTPEALVSAADQALYLAKSGGRNRVVVAGEEPSGGSETQAFGTARIRG